MKKIYNKGEDTNINEYMLEEKKYSPTLSFTLHSNHVCISDFREMAIMKENKQNKEVRINKKKYIYIY